MSVKPIHFYKLHFMKYHPVFVINTQLQENSEKIKFQPTTFNRRIWRHQRKQKKQHRSRKMKTIQTARKSILQADKKNLT